MFSCFRVVSESANKTKRRFGVQKKLVKRWVVEEGVVVSLEVFGSVSVMKKNIHKDESENLQNSNERRGIGTYSQTRGTVQGNQACIPRLW